MSNSDYDREWTAVLNHTTRRRVGYSKEQDGISKFVVQLEYNLHGEWVAVVRSDHDPEHPMAHDVTEEGVHLDVYRHGAKLRSEELFPPMSPAEAFTYAEEHIVEHAERYTRRFEQWHNVHSDR